MAWCYVTILSAMSIKRFWCGSLPRRGEDVGAKGGPTSESQLRTQHSDHWGHFFEESQHCSWNLKPTTKMPPHRPGIFQLLRHSFYTSAPPTVIKAVASRVHSQISPPWWWREDCFWIHAVIAADGDGCLLPPLGLPFTPGIKRELFLEDAACANAHGVYVDTNHTDCVHTRVKGDNKHANYWLRSQITKYNVLERRSMPFLALFCRQCSHSLTINADNTI